MALQVKQVVQIYLFQEIEEMITAVDKNGDGKINYSEFRVTKNLHLTIHYNLFKKINLLENALVKLDYIVDSLTYLLFAENYLGLC